MNSKSTERSSILRPSAKSIQVWVAGIPAALPNAAHAGPVPVAWSNTRAVGCRHPRWALNPKHAGSTPASCSNYSCNPCAERESNGADSRIRLAEGPFDWPTLSPPTRRPGSRRRSGRRPTRPVTRVRRRSVGTLRPLGLRASIPGAIGLENISMILLIPMGLPFGSGWLRGVVTTGTRDWARCRPMGLLCVGLAWRTELQQRGSA